MVTEDLEHVLAPLKLVGGLMRSYDNQSTMPGRKHDAENAFSQSHASFKTIFNFAGNMPWTS